MRGALVDPARYQGVLGAAVRTLERIILGRLSKGTASGLELVEGCRVSSPWWRQFGLQGAVHRALEDLARMGLVVGLRPDGLGDAELLLLRVPFTRVRWSATFGRGLLSSSELRAAVELADSRGVAP